jgi:hypothetical protein
MIVRDLEGNVSQWQLTGNMAKGKIANKSNLHLKARSILILCFPTLQILEEVPVVIRKNETLFLDFYLPLIQMCVEVHGEQHYKFVPFYHHNTLGFIRSQKRDREKVEWCENNQIKFIALPFHENENQWTGRLTNEQNS